MGVSALQNSITQLTNVNARGVSGLKSQASNNPGQRCRLGRSRAAQVPAARETAAGPVTSVMDAGSAGHG